MAAPIFLIGFMAVGKTTLGRALSAAAGLPFVDLDEEVERRAGMSVSEIFASEGADCFRRMEADTLADIIADAEARTDRAVIVACGGGTPCRPSSMDMMLARGTVVWLQADTARVLDRLLAAPGQRPLIDRLGGDREAVASHVAALQAERLAHYSRAHHTFDTTRLDTPDEVQDTVTQFINRFIK